MSKEILNGMSVLDIFQQSQETIEDAKKKISEETRQQTKFLRLAKDGTLTLRVLPLAPVIDAEGNVTMPRKGYEYPTKEFLLKIKVGVDKAGKDKFAYVNVCHTKYAFPELANDLIDLYVRIACDKYSDDDALCKTIKSSSFNKGLRYDSKRCMYVYNMEDRPAGLQILQLSYAQYKDLEDIKINLWEKLINKSKGEEQVLCPISSIGAAYPVEFIRKTDNKTEYKFNVDTLSDTDKLSEDELNALLDAPRLPEVIYRYSRYHLEATIEYLKQYDEAMQIDVMSEKEIVDCIDQIKMLLPAEDTSHFTKNSKEEEEGAKGANDLEGLWKQYDAMEAAGLDDKTDEGAELRASIREFIEENELDVHITRRISNYDLLLAIEDELNEGGEEEAGDPEPENEPAESPAKKESPAEDPEPEDDDEPEDDESASPRRTRNDDTNEPAAHTRRAARPVRRR